jgi:hypothetical protein
MTIKDNEKANLAFSDYIKQNSLKNFPIISLLSVLFVSQRIFEIFKGFPVSGERGIMSIIYSVFIIASYFMGKRWSMMITPCILICFVLRGAFELNTVRLLSSVDEDVDYIGLMQLSEMSFFIQWIITLNLCNSNFIMTQYMLPPLAYFFTTACVV